MNYLAHLSLSTNSPEHRLGNLLPDFSKPHEWQGLNGKVLEGINEHRKVDHLTDNHPIFKNLKSTVSPGRRRFAAIILDIAFDYFLSQNWDQWHPVPLDEFIDKVNQELLDRVHLAPELARRRIQLMANNNWLTSYTHVEGLTRVFKGLNQRIRYPNSILGAEEEVLKNKEYWCEGFIKVFSGVCKEVKR